MKQVLQRFFCLALVCAALMTTARADTKTPRVTRDNFVSLEFFSRAQAQQPAYSLRLDNGGLRVKTEPIFVSGGYGGSGFGIPHQAPFNDWSAPAPLSNAQFQAALKTIDGAQLPKNVGVTRGKSPFREFVETLTLTLSDSNNRDQKFALQSFGDGAPRALGQVKEFFRKLQIEKFGEKPMVAPLLVTRHNFASLTWKTSHGFPGLTAVLDIAPRPPLSSRGGWVLGWSNWSPTGASRENKRESEVFFEEIDELVRLINLANFPNLNGQNFRQEGLSDGFNDTLTLVLKDGQTFSVSNYGDTAPPEFGALVSYLQKLQIGKSANANSPKPGA